jgi:hypothetical protein
MRSAPRRYKKRRTGATGQLRSAREAEKRRRYSSVDSSAREAVKIESEHVKLKNLHCKKPLPGNGW